MKRPIEELIIEYFKFINPNPIDEVSLRFSENKKICFISITCDTFKTWCSYIKRYKGDKLTERLRQEMEDMFSMYGFSISLSLKFDFDEVF
jgi:hypothetical protein